MPPRNQVVHAIPRLESMSCSNGRKNSICRSSIAAFQNHSRSEVDFAMSSRYPAIPCRRMNRPMFEYSTTSAVGFQT